MDIDDNRNIQVDVAVNFGNSGGPLLDDTGSVVGVVNAKLSGQRIAKVGFAVPIDDACKMLDRHQIAYNKDASTKKISGVELAKRVTPAVLFIKAKVGPEASRANNYRLSANGSFKTTGWSKGDELETVTSEVIIGRKRRGDRYQRRHDFALATWFGLYSADRILALASKTRVESRIGHDHFAA